MSFPYVEMPAGNYRHDRQGEKDGIRCSRCSESYSWRHLAACRQYYGSSWVPPIAVEQFEREVERWQQEEIERAAAIESIRRTFAQELQRQEDARRQEEAGRARWSREQVQLAAARRRVRLEQEEAARRAREHRAKLAAERYRRKKEEARRLAELRPELLRKQALARRRENRRLRQFNLMTVEKVHQDNLLNLASSYANRVINEAFDRLEFDSWPDPLIMGGK